MRFNRLDLNLLVALDALLTERNISRAAEKIHISQSTMSHALARLREHFQDELLVQVGRRMELTSRAEALGDPIRDVLVRITAAVDTEQVFDPAKSDREFVLRISDYAMQVFAPHVFRLAHAQGSTVRFKMLEQVSSPSRSLERGEVDVLIAPSAYCSDAHPTEPLFEENFVCVIWRDSRLAATELTFDRYASARHAAMEPTDHVNRFFERAGVSRSIEVSSYSFATIPWMVVGTEMIATVHARLAHRLAAVLPLKVVPVPLEMPPLVELMQWHMHRTNDPGLAWLRSLLKAAAVEMDLNA